MEQEKTILFLSCFRSLLVAFAHTTVWVPKRTDNFMVCHHFKHAIWQPFLRKLSVSLTLVLLLGLSDWAFGWGWLSTAHQKPILTATSGTWPRPPLGRNKQQKVYSEKDIPFSKDFLQGVHLNRFFAHQDGQQSDSGVHQGWGVRMPGNSAPRAVCFRLL